MAKQIFIGGTGRSGTSILSRYLGDHEEISQIPLETRLLVNRGGMIDVYFDLTQNFSLSRGRTAIANFELLISDMRNKFSSPYIGYDIGKIFGSEQLETALNEFLGSVSAGSYTAWERDVKEIHHKRKYFHRVVYFYFTNILKILLKNKSNGLIKKNKKGYKAIVEESRHHTCRYFEDKEEILNLIRKFVDDLFLSYAEREGKSSWCEATPENIMHADFLSDLYPNAYFLHIVRHPVGVAQSWMQRNWGPSEIEILCKYLSSGYDRMISIEKNIKDKKTNLVTIKLEDMCVRDNRIELFDFLGVSNEIYSKEVFDIEKVNYWKNAETKERWMIQEALEPYIEHYGYEKL